MFVAKLDAAGNHLGSRRFGDADRQDTRSVAVDAAGNVFVTGGISCTDAATLDRWIRKAVSVTSVDALFE